MPPVPTGRVVAGDHGLDLVVRRRFDAPVEHLWADVTDPELTARWFGTWKGEPGEGRTVHLRSDFEDGAPWSDVLIRVCRPPHTLGVTFAEPAPGWVVDLDLTAVDGGTELTLTHRGVDAAAVGDIGPGWEYYLDLLVAARNGAAHPSFDDYLPAQSAWFTGQAGTLADSPRPEAAS